MVSFPNCKINIGLHVTEKRSDGYHNIESVMAPVSWSDMLEIIPADGDASDVEYKSTGIRLYGARENNLCIKAYHLLAENYSMPPVKMHLHKIIPVGAGLGGGSSDAACVLSMLNKIFHLRIEEVQLEKFAAELGSDCPFFIHNKILFAYGKGDKSEPLTIKLGNYFLVIIKPRIHVSTAEAYSWILPRKRKSSLKELIKLPVEEWKNNIENDFELPVFERFPAIRNIKSRLYKLGALYASMSGSGSSVFGIFKEEKHLNTYFRSSSVWEGKILSGK